MTSRDFFWAILEILAALILLIPVSVEIFHFRRIEVHDRLLVLLILSVMLMLCSGALSRFLLGIPEMEWAIYVLAALTYAFILASVSVYTEYILSFIRKRTDVSTFFRFVPQGICIALVVISTAMLPTGLILTIDPVTIRPVFKEGFAVQIGLTALPMLIDFFMLLHYRKTLGSKNMLAFLLFMLLPALSLPVVIVWNTVPAQLMQAVTVLLIYSIVHSNQNYDAVRQKKILSTDRAKLVFSQMQPHFMFNALDTIYYLCDTDPETAKTAISDFSDYLHINLSASEFQEPVPFKTELKHTEKYLSLEKLRFEERLHIVWDIQTKDFCLPVLTVQPLVENAVKHGVNKRKEGGTVTIRTEKLKNGFQITVTDDGVGFDTTKEIVNTESRTHIGIAGVRRCLQLMSGGSLDISSQPDVGTTATIHLPKTAAISKGRDAR